MPRSVKYTPLLCAAAHGAGKLVASSLLAQLGLGRACARRAGPFLHLREGGLHQGTLLLQMNGRRAD